MLGELTKGSCSMFGAWDSALPSGDGVLQLRALDWNMDGGNKNNLLLYEIKKSAQKTRMIIFQAIKICREVMPKFLCLLLVSLVQGFRVLGYWWLFRQTISALTIHLIVNSFKFFLSFV